MSRSGSKRGSDAGAEAGRVSQSVSRRLSQIAACRGRGESVKAYAARTGQSVYPFYEATRQARRAGVLPARRVVRRRPSPIGRTTEAGHRFVEAIVRTDPGAEIRRDAVAWRLRLPGGAVLEATTPLDASALDRLLAAIGSKP